MFLEEMRNAYAVSLEEPGVMRPTGRPGRR
jgi:hypothetical protein